MNHDDSVYIKHILDAIKDIEQSTKGLSKEKLQNSKDVKDACVRRLEVIGEAVKNISQKTKADYPLIEWKKIAGLRDILIHEYFGIDLGNVWKVVTEDIPALKKNIDQILKEKTK